MNKEEAKARLRKAESNLRSANIVLEMHEQGVQEIKEEIAKLEAIINEKDDWRLAEVSDSCQKLYEEKADLLADMVYFAYVRNEGWFPDWENGKQFKYGIVLKKVEIKVDWVTTNNTFVFGVAVKSREIAEEMIEEFEEKIKAVYNKQY